MVGCSCNKQVGERASAPWCSLEHVPRWFGRRSRPCSGSILQTFQLQTDILGARFLHDLPLLIRRLKFAPSVSDHASTSCAGTLGFEGVLRAKPINRRDGRGSSLFACPCRAEDQGDDYEDATSHESVLSLQPSCLSKLDNERAGQERARNFEKSRRRGGLIPAVSFFRPAAKSCSIFA